MKLNQLGKALSTNLPYGDYELCYRNEHGQVFGFNGGISVAHPNKIIIIELEKE